MNETVRLVSYVRSAWLPALCIALVSFFAWHAVAGNSGVLALGGLQGRAS